MLIRDYNGCAEWSVEEVLRRYEEDCQQFHHAERRILEPKACIEGQTRWVYPIMSSVIEGIKDDDPACTEIGIDFISESKSFPFGKSLKSQTAHALKRATLNERQAERVRIRVVMEANGSRMERYLAYCKSI